MPQSFTDLIDLSLLSRFLDKLKLYFIARKASSIPWGQVDSTSTSTNYTATVEGITELRDGVCVMLMNGVVTSASGFTININNLGAKPVYSTLAAASRSTTLFNINYTLLLVYNSHRVSGGCWDAYYGYDSNTNTIGYQLRTTSTTMPVTDKFYRYRLLFTAADREHYVPANTSTSTNATASRAVNQRPIDPFGPIFYYGHTTAINANENPSTSYMWVQYNFNIGYSFNNTGVAQTMVSNKPVYIKCTPQNDNSAIIDPDTPYVQSLPSTEDGKIYIFLGIASGAENVEMIPQHPIFYYYNGLIRLWTGNVSSAEFQRKPVVVWEASTGGLDGIQADLSASPAWQLTDLDLAPYKRIKIYSKAGKGTTDISTTPAIVLEMLLDSRAASSNWGGNYCGSIMVQKSNDANRFATLTCAVSADKTKFVVLRQSSIYGTAATTNNDIGASVFKIEGYYD